MSIRRVTPNITSNRLVDSLRFYTEFLPFQVAMDLPLDEGRIVTLNSPSNPTAQLSLVEGIASDVSDHPMTLTIEVSNVDALHARAVASRIEVIYPLTTESWGVRRFHVVDPNGVVVNIMTHHHDAG